MPDPPTDAAPLTEAELEALLRQAWEDTRAVREEQLAGERISDEVRAFRFHVRCEPLSLEGVTDDDWRVYWQNY